MSCRLSALAPAARRLSSIFLSTHVLTLSQREANTSGIIQCSYCRNANPLLLLRPNRPTTIRFDYRGTAASDLKQETNAGRLEQQGDTLNSVPYKRTFIPDTL